MRLTGGWFLLYGYIAMLGQQNIKKKTEIFPIFGRIRGNSRELIFARIRALALLTVLFVCKFCLLANIEKSETVSEGTRENKTL